MSCLVYFCRLSAAAANKLRDNNPGIADLSDPNRPMKLAEKLSELYDNEWTNAMEIMEDKGIEEEEGIQILLNILTVCNLYLENLYIECINITLFHLSGSMVEVCLESRKSHVLTPAWSYLLYFHNFKKKLKCF